MATLSLNCLNKKQNIVTEGTGIAIGSRIIVHYSITKTNPTDLLSNLPDFQFYLSKNNILSITKIPLKIIKLWQCQTYKQYFSKYLQSNDFGNQDIGYSATFLLLEFENGTDKSTKPIQGVNQGKRVKVGESKSYFSSYGLDGIIAYTFGCGNFFVVNVEANPGDTVYGFDKTSEYSLGLVIYKDVLPYPLQVFPLCISLDHLVSQRCWEQNCNCNSITSSSSNIALPTKFNSISKVCLVQCGINIGSGTLIHNSIILTCSHNIIQHVHSTVNVYFNEIPYHAKVIYEVNKDEYPDIALLEIISSCNIHDPVQISEKSSQIGDIVFALGIPFIKGWYKNDSWISSGRIVNKQLGHLIASCGVHQGFSGGCLVDVGGKMIGVICAKAFPIDESTKPLRLTQIIPISAMKDQIFKFIASERNEKDQAELTRQLIIKQETKSSL